MQFATQSAMAASRCMRPFLGSAKRIKITHSFQSCHQTFLRAKSSRADDEERRPPRAPKRSEEADSDKPMPDLEDPDLTLEERLRALGMDQKEFDELWESEEAAQQRFKAWRPNTRQEAEQKWKELQETPDHLEFLDIMKNSGVEPIKLAKDRGITLPNQPTPMDPALEARIDQVRAPLNLQAIHMRPLRRVATHGYPSCDLQLRTYSLPNLLLFADFAVRAAYYMGLCARGPIPLPRVIERWTVPRANFIFKKSQENFERRTMRRLIQIHDGHPDVVHAWLAFLSKHQYFGVGMKANVWEFEGLEKATRAGYRVEEGDWSRRRTGKVLEKVEEILGRKEFREAMKGAGVKGEVSVAP